MSPQPEPVITPEIVAAHGLKPDEYKHFLELLGRTPTMTELGICSAMWNEHCSYKSSKKWLKTLPTKGKRVICGPGENAGIVEVAPGVGLAFKMESHNHPSYIEPYQGAATGVGGILRDVFCMGARPVANLNCLRYGEGEYNAHLLKHTVRGIGDYGNSVGVPTVGGEVNFHPAYNGNILVNAIAPGPIVAPPGTSSDEMKAVSEATPLGRWGGEAEIARAVLALLDSDFITGETLRVDGGRHLK